MIKSRFAPSPTGHLHIGGVRTALFAYLYTKHHKGQFVLRIEDSDLERSTQAYTHAILEAMDWLGLKCDEPPCYQTSQFKHHRKIIQQLLNEHKAYYCNCSSSRLSQLRADLKAQGKKPKYDNKCRTLNLSKGVVRFKNPVDGEVVFSDLTKGEIRTSNRELDDLIIARSDGTPTYNLSAVVDDHNMGITTIIRGDDHLSNTPRQINLYQALAWSIPNFAHLPLILGLGGARLSKRHGTTSVLQYKKDGFLPQALLNYLVRLGWSYGDKELFSLAEMVDLFDIKAVNQAAAKFDVEKLLWLNQQHIKAMTGTKLLPHLQYHLHKLAIDTSQGADVLAVIDLLKTRCKTLLELVQQMRLFYQAPHGYNQTMAEKHFNKKSLPILQLLLEKLTALNSWQAEGIKCIITDIYRQKNISFAQVGQPFRLALSGDGVAPDIAKTAQLVGRVQSLARLQQAINYIA